MALRSARSGNQLAQAVSRAAAGCRGAVSHAISQSPPAAALAAGAMHAHAVFSLTLFSAAGSTTARSSGCSGPWPVFWASQRGLRVLKTTSHQFRHFAPPTWPLSRGQPWIGYGHVLRLHECDVICGRPARAGRERALGLALGGAGRGGLLSSDANAEPGSFPVPNGRSGRPGGETHKKNRWRNARRRRPSRPIAH